MKRNPWAAHVVAVSPSKPLTRRQWERDRIADAFIAFGMVIDPLVNTVPGYRRYTVSVTLKGRRVVSNLPEIQAALDEAWTRMLPSKEQLDREWEQRKRFMGAVRKLGQASGRSMEACAARVLQGEAG